MPTLHPFMLLGTQVLGADITARVHRQMATNLPFSIDPTDEVILSNVASKFYESIRTVALQIAREMGPGVVVCANSEIRFVKYGDWDGLCFQAEVLRACEDTSDLLLVLGRERDASFVRLSARRRRSIIGHCRGTGEIARGEVLDRGLQYLLENC